MAFLLVSAGRGAERPTSRAASTLVDAGGRTVGTATIRQMPLGLRLTVKAQGLPPGVHGLRIDAVGNCTGPGFGSAGAHWNPAVKQHGRADSAGTHRDDLPNLIIGAKGTGGLRAFVPGGRLAGGGMALLDADGAAIVIDAGPDDRSAPAGNAGPGIACGVFAAD